MTGRRVVLTLHPIALDVLAQQKKKQEKLPENDLVFQLATVNEAPKMLGEWVIKAGIEKHII